jgi:hypothetical protein
MRNDAVSQSESARLEVSVAQHDAHVWSCKSKLEKFWVPEGLSAADRGELNYLSRYQTIDGKTSGQIQRELLEDLGIEPVVTEHMGNLLMYGGASCQWQTLIGNGTATAGQALTFFNNTQAAIGVGDSSTAAAATQTNLQGTTNVTDRIRVAMDATYPQHTDATTSGAANIIFKSTFSTSQANFAWQEWGVFNSATDATGRMLQRKVESLGTKTAASTWALSITLSLA